VDCISCKFDFRLNCDRDLIEKVDERRKNDSSRAFFELCHVL